MPALRQSSPSDMPAALALASISAGVSKPLDIRKPYLQECTRSSAESRDGRDAAPCAEMHGVDHHIIRDFLRQAAAALDTDLTGLARKAGVAASTVTRIFKDEEGSLPSWRTLAKVAQASGVPIPSAIATPDQEEILASLAQQLERLDAMLKQAATTIVELAERTSESRQVHAEGLPKHELRHWLESLPRVPSAQRNHLLEVVRGIAERSAASQDDPQPSEGSRIVHAGKRSTQLSKA